MIEDSAALRRAKAGLHKSLHGFAPLTNDSTPSTQAGFHRLEVDSTRLPVPELPRLALSLLGSRNLGRGEKLAWAYPFTVDGTYCYLAHEKFGLRLYIAATNVDDAEALVLGKRIVRMLDRAQRGLEKDFLRELSEEQARQGNVTIRNQYGRLLGVYEYFRDGAELAFSGQGRLGTRHPRGGQWIAPRQVEGFYNTVAMISAYFSILEHILVLSLPFLGQTPDRINIKEFIGARWGDKFKTLFDVEADAAAKAHFDALHRIAEDYRNTYGHGGFDKAGASIGFHLPGIGALPAALSNIRDSPEFDFLPVDAESFDQVKRVFNAVDAWLSDMANVHGMAWVKSGLDARYDADFLEEIHQARQPDGDFEELISSHSYAADQHANMDY